MNSVQVFRNLTLLIVLILLAVFVSSVIVIAQNAEGLAVLTSPTPTVVASN